MMLLCRKIQSNGLLRAKPVFGITNFGKLGSSKAKIFTLKNTPFEEVTKQSGEKNGIESEEMKDLNKMYNDMFEETNIGADKRQNLEQDDADIDLINQEISELFGMTTDEKKLAETVERVEIKSAKKFVEIVRSKKRFCLITKSVDPVYNLAIEDYVFRNTPTSKKDLKDKFTSERLLLYVNDKTCVFGKNQNPFKELNLSSPLLKTNGGNYDIIRRFSGGGTVIHDLGNVNYSFLTSRNQFDKKFYNSCIINLVNNFVLAQQNPNKPNMQFLPLELNQRGDITCNNFKISGSAYKIAMNKSYHHGTMLIDSNLKEFSKLMRPKLYKDENEAGKEEEFTECNDVESIRSKIANLKDLTHQKLSDTSTFIELIAKGFSEMFDNDKPVIYSIDAEMVNLKEVYHLDKETNKSTALSLLQSDDWMYLETPAFKYTNKISGFYYRVKKGIVTESNDTANVKINETRFHKQLLV